MKPNILLLMTDQQRADALGCVTPWMETPHMDRIATEGVRFSRCVTNSPVCIPTRRSMATGHYPHNTGIWAQSGDDARPGGAELDARRARGGLPHQPVRQDPPQSRRRRPEGAGAPAHRAGHRRRLRDGGAAAVRHNAVTHDRGVGVTGHLGRLPARLRGALCQQATPGPAVPAGLRTLLRYPRGPEGEGLPGGLRSRSALVLLGQLRRPARALGYARTLVLALRSRTDAARPER